MTNETVRDVCAEMNGNEFDEPHLNGDGIVGARILAKGWAKRILAAYEREMAAKRENDRLRAALKPVLAVNIDGMDSYCRVNCESLLKSIVREAQRIYKEGATND